MRKILFVIDLQHDFIHGLTEHEARQALIYQLDLGLTGETGKYNYSKAVHVYPPFFDITYSAKNYKIAPALTGTDRAGSLHDGVAGAA